MKTLLISICLLASIFNYSDLSEQLNADIKLNNLRNNKFISRNNYKDIQRSKKLKDITFNLKISIDPLQDTTIVYITQLTKENIITYLLKDINEQLLKVYITDQFSGTLYYSYGKVKVSRIFDLKKKGERELKNQLKGIMNELNIE